MPKGITICGWRGWEWSAEPKAGLRQQQLACNISKRTEQNDGPVESWSFQGNPFIGRWYQFSRIISASTARTEHLLLGFRRLLLVPATAKEFARGERQLNGPMRSWAANFVFRTFLRNNERLSVPPPPLCSELPLMPLFARSACRCWAINCSAIFAWGIMPAFGSGPWPVPADGFCSASTAL